MKKAITLGKLIGLLLLFCLPLLLLLSVLFFFNSNLLTYIQKTTTSNELARPGIGIIFLVIIVHSKIMRCYGTILLGCFGTDYMCNTLECFMCEYGYQIQHSHSN